MAGVAIARKMIDEQELMRRLLAGYTLKECAALLEVTYHTVCARARRPEFLSQLKELNSSMWDGVDDELRKIHGNLTERVVEISSRALDRLEALLEDEGTDDKLVARIAQDFLDRNPETGKSTKSTVLNKHEFINPLQLKMAHHAAMEMDDAKIAPTLEADLG